MPAASLKVYLDHHIRRDDLLYRRTLSAVDSSEGEVAYSPHIRIRDLFGDQSIEHDLRKPDFQRATWAWTADDCVDLLQSVLNEQVVPSVIMWLSPNENLQYVLDGGHRISVLLAWIRDDWGDKLPSDQYNDPVLEHNIKQAAKQVRALLQRRSIASFQEHIIANRRFKELAETSKSPEFEMDAAGLPAVKRVRRWNAVNIGFPILWVKGDYDKAEESFLKINKTGRRLSEWETKLVENRTSSFARVVMSLSHVHNAAHCWPAKGEVASDEVLFEKVANILARVRELHGLLFEPPYKTPVTDQKQPLMVIPPTRPERKPAYLAELLTIIEGKKGQKPETEILIKRDSSDKVSHIVSNALRLIEEAGDVVNNIYGPSPRSLALMPLVYFYNSQGIYVRSLLYGMVYWMNHGNESSEVFARKLIFAANRRAFETVLIASKDRIIRRIARRIGSGPEVTIQTARYFNGLLELICKHNGEVDTDTFKTEHDFLVETLGSHGKGESSVPDDEIVSPSPMFRGRMRNSVDVNDLLSMFKYCEICGGRYFPGLFTQVDHKQARAKGGKTTPSNARNTHPFCNNNRDRIEKLTERSEALELPEFEKSTNGGQIQLKFLFTDDNEELETLESQEPLADSLDD